MHAVRHLLLALVLCLTQLGAGAHAIEHALDEAQGLQVHICEQCLSAHDLGSALPTQAALPPVFTGDLSYGSEQVSSCFHLPSPNARQGAPPVA